MKKLAFLLLLIAFAGCNAQTTEQVLRPDQPVATTTPEAKKRGLIVTDNPYTISNDRLEQMNKGGFGGY